MKAKYLFLFFVAPLCLTACSDDEPMEDNASPNWKNVDKLELTSAEKVDMANLNSFGSKLIGELATSNRDGEFTISPFGLSVYMSMLANTCDAATQQQIVDALGFSNLQSMNSINTKLLQYFPSKAMGVNMTISNRVWLPEGLVAPNAYIDAMADVFNAKVENADFASPQTVKDINKWVSDKTKGMIPYFLPEETSLYGSKFFALNAVYFLGKWAEEFDPKFTKKQSFFTPGGVVDVDMMHQRDGLLYAENERVQRVKKHFDKKQNYIELYLPAEGVNVADIAANLEAEDAKLRDEDYFVNLSLPKFEKSYDAHAIDAVLARMGVQGIRSMKLSRLGIEDNFDSGIMQKTAIKLDEIGVEMSAVTGNDFTVGSHPETKLTFDRPFLYVVRNEQSGAILMAGVVQNPNLKK